MGSKRQRPHEEEDQEPLPDRGDRKRTKKRTQTNDMEAPRPSTSVNYIKRQLRDVRRTLERSENLPADIRVEKERALAGYKLDLEKTEYEKRKQQMIKKYHMVRFFERKKATRRLKRLKARLSKTDRESEEYVDLQNKIHRAEVDLNYTLYCPLAEKYTSLYKQKEGTVNGGGTVNDDTMISQGSEALVERPAIWSTVEKCTADGTLSALRDGKLSPALASNTRTESSATPKKSASQKGNKTKSRNAGRKEAKSSLSQTGADASDEGFFEE